MNLFHHFDLKGIFTCIEGAADKASVKQIIHISSASCLRLELEEEHPWRHGKQTSSPLIPPQIWPHGWILLHALVACCCTTDRRRTITIQHIRFTYQIKNNVRVSTWHSSSKQIPSSDNLLVVRPQKRHISFLIPVLL